MRVRKLTDDYDYSFGQSQKNFLIDSPAAVAQIVETSLNLFLGEWYLDQTQGMPWLEGVIGKYSKSTADLTVQTFIASIPNVTEINEYQSESDQGPRTYSAQATISTPFGETDISILQEL